MERRLHMNASVLSFGQLPVGNFELPPGPAMGTGEPIVAVGCSAICGKVGVLLPKRGPLRRSVCLGCGGTTPLGGLAMPVCFVTPPLKLALVLPAPVCARALPPQARANRPTSITRFIAASVIAIAVYIGC